MDEPQTTVTEAQSDCDALCRELIELLDRGARQRLRTTVGLHHAADVADAVEPLPPEQTAKILGLLDAETAAEILEELNPDVQPRVAEQMQPERLADLLDELPSDDAADILGEFDPEEQQELLELMEEAESADVVDLLAYSPDTAGGIMAAEVLAVQDGWTADQAIAHLRERQLDAETPYYLYAVDERHHLMGVVNLRQLISAPGDRPVRHLMVRQILTVHPDDDQEIVADVFRKYDLLALPVVDATGRLLGVVTADDVMDVITEELEEDYLRFAGTYEEAERPRPALHAARLRLPVVVFCLCAEIVAGFGVLAFESRLANVAVLAAFMPALIATGGNIGQQSLATVLRTIASGERVTPSLWRAAGRELSIGAVVGLVAGIVLGTAALVLRRDPELGMLLAGVLILTSTVASLLGASIPLVLDRMGLDPANMSGPLLTTVNDIISTFLYFALAVAALSHFGVG